VASAVTAGCSVILRAIQRPGLITAANLVGGIFGIASIYPLIEKWNLGGAAYGLLASQVVTALASVGLVFFAKWNPSGLESARTFPDPAASIACTESS
jgi:O-antigen/teichoic acid export membrane protein